MKKVKAKTKKSLKKNKSTKSKGKKISTSFSSKQYIQPGGRGDMVGQSSSFPGHRGGGPTINRGGGGFL